jgi:hypothetical protein
MMSEPNRFHSSRPPITAVNIGLTTVSIGPPRDEKLLIA